MKVGRSSYYAWKKRKLSKQGIQKAYIQSKITDLHQTHKGRIGLTKLHYLLTQEMGIAIAYPTLVRYRKELGFIARSTHKKFRKETIIDTVLTNHVDRQFNEQNIYLCDFSQVRLKTGQWIYLCVLFNTAYRYVEDVQVSLHPDSQTVIELLSRQQFQSNQPIIFHTDQGSHFRSISVSLYCEQHGIIQSFSKKACPYDNAPMESWFSRLKSEQLNHYELYSFADVYQLTHEYIDYYNLSRPHASLQYKTPFQAKFSA